MWMGVEGAGMDQAGVNRDFGRGDSGDGNVGHGNGVDEEGSPSIRWHGYDLVWRRCDWCNKLQYLHCPPTRTEPPMVA